MRIAVAKFLRTCIRDSMKPLHLCMDNIIGMLLCILDDDDEEVHDTDLPLSSIKVAFCCSGSAYIYFYAVASIHFNF